MMEIWDRNSRGKNKHQNKEAGTSIQQQTKTFSSYAHSWTTRQGHTIFHARRKHCLDSGIASHSYCDQEIHNKNFTWIVDFGATQSSSSWFWTRPK